METTTKTVKKIISNRAYYKNALSATLSLDGEENHIFLKDAKVFIEEVQPLSGSAKISAKILYNICYKRDENVECYESAGEYNCEISNENITPFSVINVSGFVDDLKLSSQDEKTEISGIINLEAHFFSFSDVEVVEDIKDAICKNQQITAPLKVLFERGNFELEGDKDFSFMVDKILSKDENIRIFDLTVKNDEVVAEGEVSSSFLFLTTEGKLVKDSFVMPFRYEMDCSGCKPTDKAFACAYITDAKYKVTTDENTSSTHISSLYSVNYGVTVLKLGSVNCVSDAFSPQCYLKGEKSECELLQNTKILTYKHHIFGEAFCDVKNLKVLSSANANIGGINYKKSEKGLEISGAITCDIIAEGEKGATTKVAEMPFVCEFACENLPVDVNTVISNLTAKQQEEKCFVECDLLFTMPVSEKTSCEIYTNFEEGEKREQDNSAISIVFVEKGEDIWQVCKKAGTGEKDLLLQNPDLHFPIEKDSQIIIYHQLKEF